MKKQNLENNLKSFSLKPKEEKLELIEAECQNCRKKVMIIVPFYGCIFCEDCRKGENYETADAPEFKIRFNYI